MNSGQFAGGGPLNEPRMTVDEAEELVIYILLAGRLFRSSPVRQV